MTQVEPVTTYRSSSDIQITRIPLEAFPGFWAFAYLVRVNDWNVLIDTGSGSDVSNEGLVRGFKEVGLELLDLTHILVTHGHIDHYGGLTFLRKSSKAKIGIHELDLGTISNHEARLAILSARLETFLERAGIPPEKRSELLAMYRLTKLSYRSVSVDFTYESGDMKVDPFKLIHVPGHCPGHVAIKLDDVVFCGDLILDKVTPHQSPEDLVPYMGVHHFLESLSAFEIWAKYATLVFNGHDEPIEDLPAKVVSVRRNLQRRIDQTLEVLSESKTLIEASEQVYGEMQGYNELLVIEKIGAYVEYLQQKGLVEIVNPTELDGEPRAAIKYCRR